MSRALITLLLAAACLAPRLASADKNPFAAGAKSGTFRTSDGVRLHYFEAGKGRAIVFVPGWTVPAWMWDPQIRYFAKDYHVIALDPRSQGESERPTEGNHLERRAQDIKELVEKLKLAPAILVGHSLAARELLSYVDQFGTGTLAGVVLVDHAIGPFPKPEEAASFHALLRQVGTNRRELLGRMIPNFFKKPLPTGYKERLIEDAMKTPSNTALALIAGSMGTDFKPKLPGMRIPVLYAITPQYRDDGEWVKTNVPGAKVEMFENAGHVLFMDEQDRFNALVDEFARSSFRAP